MSPGGPERDAELESLLQFRRASRRIPDDVRARVLARSRAFLSGGPALFPTSLFDGLTSPPASVSPGRVLGRLAVAASIVIAAGAAGAFAALHSRAPDGPSAASPVSAMALPTAARERTIQDPGPVIPMKSSHRTAARPHPTPIDPSAEVELLERAQLAYARRDFSSALALVAEHARRFPRGPLAEECAALRVESLVGAGRADEARRAGRDFAARFPRSVLLPRIEAASDDPE
jgi:hypothetical protein